MNFKIAIIIIMVLGHIYQAVLNIVKYRSANNPTPKNVSDVYDAETYAKWKKYSAEHCTVSLVFTLVYCVVYLVLLLTNAFSMLSGIFPQTFGMQILSVLLVELAVDVVLGTVQKYIENMVIEQKYGFNRTKMKTFIADRIRSILLNFAFGYFIAFLIGDFYEKTGAWMIVLFATAMLVVILVATFLAPVFMRIGNKFTPLEDGELKDRLMEMLTKHGYRVKAIKVMDASRRTTKLNAYFTGFGKLKSIVLFDNLVEAMTPDEICAVFAHELGHGLHKDVLKGQILSFFSMTITGVIAWLAVSSEAFYTAFGFDGINYGFAYILVGFALSLVQPLIALVTNARSRAAEYAADRQAVDEGYGAALIGALKRLGKDNFAHLSPSKINVVLEYSHPPLSQRIEAIEKKITGEK